ncbi:MAG: AMMECR1 domain-containing protein [Armatimonadetes bacterium]|nr:AMMECR1 domain-containing protein [Armatimonadota bacterium]
MSAVDKPPRQACWGLFVFIALLAAPALAEDPYAAWQRAARDRGLLAEVTAITRRAVEDTVWGRALTVPRNWKSPLLSRPVGIFVTLVRDTEVRGCMGALQSAERNAAHEIARAASLAASVDTRYPAIRPEELARMEIRVSVVGPRRRAASLSQLDPLRLGLFVQRDRRGAVLLPGEALSAGRQVAECRRKAGIRSSESVLMYTFPTVVVTVPPPSSASTPSSSSKEKSK